MGRGSDMLGVFSGAGGVSGRLFERGRKKWCCCGGKEGRWGGWAE
jgi:hypothetical protein